MTSCSCKHSTHTEPNHDNQEFLRVAVVDWEYIGSRERIPLKSSVIYHKAVLSILHPKRYSGFTFPVMIKEDSLNLSIWSSVNSEITLGAEPMIWEVLESIQSEDNDARFREGAFTIIAHKKQ